MPIARIHSLVEVHLYTALLPCRACSRRGFVIVRTEVRENESGCVLAATASCGKCAEEMPLEFDAGLCESSHLRPECVRRIPVEINPTGRPSELLDVVQWLTLYRMAVDSLDFPPDRKLIRASLIEAGQCLAEALRFYDADSDIPPAASFFRADSLERFREHPELFARQRLLELASALPMTRVHPLPAISTHRPASTIWWLP